MAEHAGQVPPGSSSTPTPQILIKIIEKEREVERAIEAAQDEAARRLKEAKATAARMVAGHEESARAEAASLREGLLAEARRRADDTLREGAARAEAIRSVDGQALQAAAEHLLARVLPGDGR